MTRFFIATDNHQESKEVSRAVFFRQLENCKACAKSWEKTNHTVEGMIYWRLTTDHETWHFFMLDVLA